MMVLKHSKAEIIGIDGVDGSGKTALGEVLSQELGYVHVSIDDYLDKNRGQYINYVDYDALHCRIEQQKVPIIIEGVCLLLVLKRLKQAPDILIYIKRVSDYGVWLDEARCDVTENIDKFIEKEKQSLRIFAEEGAYIDGKEAPHDVAFPELVEEIMVHPTKAYFVS